MKKTKITSNTKIKYTDSENYNKHFTLDDRIKIQKIITEHRSDEGSLTIMLKDIGNMLSNDPSTISKEVKLHRLFKGRSVDNRLGSYNAICSKYKGCKINACIEFKPKLLLKNYCKCIERCKSFDEYICPNLKKFPWVCNGCPKAIGCHLNKFYYYSDIAHKDYKLTLRETREGINLTPDEFKVLNHTVSTYVKAGQPIYHIFASNELPVSERTVYNYFEKGYLDAKNIDLRRKVAYKKRYQHKIDKTLLKKIKQGRTYEDYQNYIKANPDASIVEMDTVISAGECNKVLLTLHFVKYHFQLAYILESKEVININACINSLCNQIGTNNFRKLFEVILTDNGTEFSDPESIEYEPETGELRSKVFFCHPYASREKGHCEKNHEYIRYILPKGTSFDFLTQDMCDLMMSHINSTKRPSVNGSPYDFMALAYGTEVLDLMKIKKIDSNMVILLPRLLTK
jgi:IS30 family transposase